MKEIKAYTAKDGTLFTDKHKCAEYENLEICHTCNGSGETSYEENTYPDGLPDSGWAERMEIFYKRCSSCSGLGYVKPKKQDPEYQEYMRLRKKFKDNK